MSAAALSCPKCGHPNDAKAGASAIPGLAQPTIPLASIAAPRVEFAEAVKIFFRKYADFRGRARRSEFWFAYLFTVIVGLPFSLLNTALEGPDEFGFFSFLQLAWNLAVLIPSLAVTSRRLHDTNTSFGYFWLILIPIVGWILVIVKLAEDSTPGENRFGESSKYS
jgi:uncharacterized membrane protein YhaH (DUF805 family)